MITSFSTLERNAAQVLATLKETDKDVLLTIKGCKIYVPTRYADCKLAIVGTETFILGVFAMVIEDRYYSVSSALATMRISPSSTSVVEIDGDEYFEFVFEKGGEITSNLNLVRNDVLIYYVYDEFIARGHVPSFMSYSDLGTLFCTSSYHAGLTLGANNAIMEIIAANNARAAKDPTTYARHTMDSFDDELKKPPTFIPLRSVAYGATDTTSRLIGAYHQEGMLSSLVYPNQRSESIESALRQ